MFNKNQSAAIHRVAKTVIALSAVSIVCLALPACQSKADEDVAKIREMMEKKEAQIKIDRAEDIAKANLHRATYRASRNPAWSSMSQSDKDKAIQAELKVLEAADAAAKVKTP
jgi:DNA-binding FadR family transcriptional regulator